MTFFKTSGILNINISVVHNILIIYIEEEMIPMKINRSLKDISKFQKPGMVHKFFLLLCAPILIVAFFIYSCNAYYSNQFQSFLIKTYSTEMNNFLETVEDEYMNISNDAELLLSIPAIGDVSYTADGVDGVAWDSVKSTQNVLHSFAARTEYAESASIFNRSGGFVVNAEGIFDADRYFSEICAYRDYNTEYWKNLKSYNDSTRLLSPTETVSYSENEKTIIPVVLPLIGEISNSLFIFNIDAEKLYDGFAKYKFTSNSHLFMINNSNGEIYSGTADGALNFLPDLSSAQRLYDTNFYSVSNIEEDGEKYLLIASQDRYAMFGFTYAVAIPYTDIESHTHKILVRILMLALGLILIMLIYAYVGSQKLSKPWRSIAKRLAGDSGADDESNVISYVNNAITMLLDKNTNLTHNLAVTLPLSQQKYLVDILNNPASGSNEEMDKLIFKYEYFVSIAINISLKQTTGTDAVILNAQLYSEVYKAIESVFAAQFVTFSLPSTNNTLYLILNTESDECSETMDETIGQIKSLLAADSDYIDIFMGIGNVYQGIDGLRLSHQEALSDIFRDMNANKIQIVDNHNLYEYSFGVYNENILINYILTGKGDETEKFICDTFESCSKSSPENRSQVYAGIYRAIGKVIKLKKIRTSTFEEKTDENILEDIMNNSDEAVRRYLLSITENIIKVETPSGKARVAEIADYIKEHFSEELYLDGLAQKFNVTPKYLSKMLKEHLGISFKVYLTSLRIDKAEELLTYDDIKINDICKMVGFMNHSAFIRAFKQKNGISPNEYRVLYQKRGGRKDGE